MAEAKSMSMTVDPIPLLIVALLSGGGAWYALKWYKERTAQAQTPASTVAGAGTGTMCSAGTVAGTIGLAAASGAAAGAAAGAPAFGIGALIGAAIGGTAGALAGIAKALATQRVCDQAVCQNMQAAYSAVLTQGQGGGRIARLIRLVNKANRRNEVCNGLTHTAGLLVGR